MNTQVANPMPKSESGAISLVRTVCVLWIVFIHARVSSVAGGENASLANTWELFFSAFGGYAMAGMFFLSGYLFFQKVPKGNGFPSFWIAKLRRRSFSLLVPFLVWSTIGQLYWHFAPGGIQQEAALLTTKSILTGNLGGMGLWYVRNLVVFSILAPLYYACYRLLGGISFLVAIALIAASPFPIRFPFFNVWLFLGGLMSFARIGLGEVAKHFPARLCLPLFIVETTLRFWNFVSIPPLTATLCQIMCFLSLFGLFANRGWSGGFFASGSAFVYFSHFYAVRIFKYGLVWAFHPVGLVPIVLSTFLSAALSAATCYGAWILLKRTCPGLLSIMTGGRT